VADVREVSRPQTLRVRLLPALGLRSGASDVGLSSQRVDNQDFDARDKFGNRPWHRAAIAQIGNKFLTRAREKIAVHG